MTREEIIEAAAQIFREKGFHAASMQDIADAVNLRKASLYYHVSSKQEILLSILDLAMDLLTERLDEIVQQEVSTAEKLEQAVACYLESMTQYPDLAGVLMMEYRSLEPGLRKRHQPRRDHFEKLWRSLVQEGIQRGEFAAVDESMAAKGLLGALNWTVTWYQENGRLTAEQIAAQISEMYLHGLLVRGDEGAVPFD